MNGIHVAMLCMVVALLIPSITFAQNNTNASNQPKSEIEPETNEIGPTGLVDDAYLQILQQTSDFRNLTTTDQETYIEKYENSIQNRTPYQKLVHEKLESLSVAILALQKAEQRGDETINYIKAVHKAIFELELIGVVSQDRFEQNKEYWSNRVMEITNQIEENNQAKILYLNKKPSISFVHTDDVSLRNHSEISYPCFPNLGRFIPVPLICIIQDIEWGGGTTSRAELSFMPLSFLYSQIGKICLTERVDHDYVIFSFDVKHQQNNILKKITWSYQKSYDNNSLPGSFSFACREDQKTRGGTAGDSIIVETHLRPLVTVRG